MNIEAYPDTEWRCTDSGTPHIVRPYPREDRGPWHLAVHARGTWSYCGRDVTDYMIIPLGWHEELASRVCGSCARAWFADDDN